MMIKNLFATAPFGIGKNSAEWTNCAKAAGFGFPRAYTGTLRGEVCSKYKAFLF
ncbi:MAG: hypothetical protein PUB07_00835 [Clostridia bacterium]|nr:hypothetical protein [Clostridia bacterium]